MEASFSELIKEAISSVRAENSECGPLNAAT